MNREAMRDRPREKDHLSCTIGQVAGYGVQPNGGEGGRASTTRWLNESGGWPVLVRGKQAPFECR